MKAALLASLAALAVGAVLPPGPLAPDLPGAIETAGCRTGFAWRRATAGDAVCVGHLSRDRIALENRLAAQRRDPESGACRDGWVPREAVAGDAVCVSPRAREAVRAENAHAALRSVVAAR